MAASTDAEAKIANLQRALRSARIIGIAVGIVMITMNIPDDEAFALIAARSNEVHKKVRDVSWQIVSSRSIAALVDVDTPATTGMMNGRSPD